MPSSSAEALVLRGNELYRQGDVESAVQSYEAAIAADAGHARAHYNLGVILQSRGRHAQAAAHYERAAAADPAMARAFLNWGNALREMGDPAGAALRYDQALALDAGDALAKHNRAAVAYEMALEAHRGDRPAEALAHFDRALSLRPDFVEALHGKAGMLMALDRIDEAAAAYERVLEQDPSHSEALNNLASFVQDRGDLPRARELFTRAAQAQPQLAEPRYNLGLLDLREHRFASGWEAYELRARADAATIGLAACALPEPAVGIWGDVRRLAVRKEQGVGDQLVFSTILPELRDTVDAMVEVDPRLIGAYRRSLPGLCFVTPAEAPTSFAGCSHQLPLGSLGRFFRRSRESFARQPTALLAADPRRLEDLRDRLPAGRKIAISWRSFQRNRHRLIAARKSAALEEFGVFEGLPATLVDLQYGEVEGERQAFDARHPGLRRQVPGLDLFDDLEGVLAAIACCDLVVTTSNVTAHFAGALGKRTWLVYLEANPPFHYWSPGADGRSLWYPSVEVMTDPTWNDWSVAFAEVARRWREEQATRR